MISVRDLHKSFGVSTAVAGISFEVARGEVVGFLGPNGAGKTTTIRVLTCFHPASAGTATVAGFDVTRQSLQVRQQLGYLPENVPIYPDLRVCEYLRYRAALKGVPWRQRKVAVERAMAKAGVVEVQRKLCGHVSRGYRQRVGLADALVANPPILILDEPTSGLDPNQRRKIKALVRELAQEHTILFSSHILGEVQDVSSRVIVIHRGTIRADGPPAELVAKNTGRVLHVAVAGTPLQLQQALAEVPWCAGIPATDAGGGAVAMQVVLPAGSDPTAMVGERLLAAGLPVRELRLQMASLEEYFHQITEGRDREAAAPAAEDAA
ncbi:MAG: ABC transporter ATP-binding protein [Planctomycetes bacterium]|nr:ABC transporter ATP-binding protein [Planctomycetota bacterium]